MNGLDMSELQLRVGGIYLARNMRIYEVIEQESSCIVDPTDPAGSRVYVNCFPFLARPCRFAKPYHPLPAKTNHLQRYTYQGYWYGCDMDTEAGPLSEIDLVEDIGDRASYPLPITPFSEHV